MADRTEPENRQGSQHDGGTVTDPGKAVFLSYASQDAEAAQRLCNALRAAGIEVWFDQSELRGGDVWDQKIRREIHDCALFIPVISANTASRHEGYFRLEWDLADQRTHMLARNRAFIVPVCLDATPDAGADVPESFQRVQWTRLPGGETPPEFVRRIEQFSQARCVPQRRRPGGLRGWPREDPHEAHGSQSRSLSRRPPPISSSRSPGVRGLHPQQPLPRRRTRSRCCRS